MDDGHPEWVDPEVSHTQEFTLIPPALEQAETSPKTIILYCEYCDNLTRHREFDQKEPKYKPVRCGFKLVWARATCLKCGSIYPEIYTPKIVHLYCPKCDPAGERKVKYFKVEPGYPHPPRTESNNYILLEPNAVCMECGSVDYSFTQLKLPDENVVSLTDQIDAATVRKI
ncbi:MAG: hypothetical protein WC526_04635 [Patescibacteria group bacterium]